MINNDLKSIWNANVTREIKLYSDWQLQYMILRSARKAIDFTYSWVFLTGCMVLTAAGLWVAFRYSTPRTYLFLGAALFIFAASIAIVIFSRNKMREYKADVPLKEWIESRIREFDKSIHRKMGYWIAITYGVSLSVIILLNGILVLTAGFSVKQTLVPLGVGVAVMVVFSEIGRRISTRRMTRAIEQLKELCRQLEGAEETE